MSGVIEMIKKENQMYINIGRKEGKKEGKKEKQIIIVKRMLRKNMPIELISEITELSIRKIEEIQKKIKK